MELTLSFFHQQPMDSAISANFTLHKYDHHKASRSLISNFLNASVPQFTHLHNGSALCF